jgi:putative aldouronate transport system permease protein
MTANRFFKQTITRHSAGEAVFDVFLYSIMIFVGIITLYPFINVLAISLNQPDDTVRGGIYLWPRIWSVESYRQIFVMNGLITAMYNSVLRTSIGAISTVFFTTMLAFTISRRDYVGRKAISIMLVITMYVSGGMIPTFILIRGLGMTNSFLVYIIPNLINVWSVFVVRSYMDTLPPALQESAKIDGANDFMIFIRIIIPLCLPVLATIGLFSAVFQWNSWFDTYIYNSTNRNLSTLQFEMMKILLNTEALKQLAQTGNTKNAEALSKMISPESMRMSITIVATVPILLVYPFLQKYIVKGLTLGGIKG